MKKSNKTIKLGFLNEIYQESMMIFVFITMFILSALFVPYFFTYRNLIGLLLAVSQIGMVSSSMMLCLASRDFDLSVGSQVAFLGVVSVLIANTTDSIVLTILGTLAAGLIVGMLNGVLVAKFKINALIATLGTMQIVRGLAYIFSDGQSISAQNNKFFFVGTTQFLGIPLPVYITFAVFLIFGIILKYSVYGRNVLAVGGNPTATYLSGLSVDRIRITNFSIQGLVCGLAGFILASRLTSAQPTVAQGFELNVISACVLGGVSLYGGKATMLGVIAGVFIMGVAQDVMNLVNLQVFYQYLVSGIILLIAVGIDQIKEHRKK